MSDLLFEIGTEEIPAGYLQPALLALEKNFAKKAKELKLTYKSIKTMGTPRRFVLSVSELLEKQEDKVEELMGPSKSAGFDNEGNATKAAQGFVRSKGADVSDLKIVETEKGDYLMLKREVIGKETKELLPEVLVSLITELTFPKSMVWGSHTNSFARPIQWLVAIFNDQVIPLSHNGLTSSNISRGHRFLANEDIVIPNADVAVYEKMLQTKEIIVDIEKRKTLVLSEITEAIKQQDLGDAVVAIDENLLNTVTNLVEIPFGVCGVFDKKFLQLPAEALITSMREHQKYFPVVDPDGNLKPAFIAVNNTRVKDLATTRKGHQRVLRARLEDALFFFESDKETALIDRCDKLDGIIFQKKLGTMADKCDRIVKITQMLSETLCPGSVNVSVRAAKICKTDLLTDMVGEFASLQGVIGGAYAINDGEGEEVALAIKEHYMPLRAGSAIPTSEAAKMVGLADRLDTLTGCFGIGQIPTGTADPFGLRRISLAILQIIRESNYQVSIKEITRKSLALYGNKVEGGADTVDKIVSFVKGRFINDLIANGVDPQAVEAVTSVQFDDVNDSITRIDAFVSIKQDEAFSVLASSFKRIRNICKDNSDTTIDVSLFEQDAERKLYDIFLTVEKAMNSKLNGCDYIGSLGSMLELKQPVDNFFDDVMVMSEDMAVRQNRLNILTAIGDLVLKVGDISKMQEA